MLVGVGEEESAYWTGTRGEEEERAYHRRWMRDPVGLVVSDLMIASAEFVGGGLF